MRSPEVLADREEIRALLVDYCRAMDRGDAAGLAGVYHPDAIDEHGSRSGSAREFAAEIVAEMDQRGEVTQHHLTNVHIELAGDRARTESYFLAVLGPADPADPAAAGRTLVGGRYLDRMERRHGRWGITHRRVVVDFGDSLGGTPWPGADSYLTGLRGPADPSYSHLSGRGGDAR